MWCSLDQSLLSQPFTYLSCTDRWNDAIANCGSFVDAFKKAVEPGEGREKEGGSTNKLVYPEGENSFPVSWLYLWNLWSGKERWVGGGGGERATLPWLLRSCYVVACLRALLIWFSTTNQCVDWQQAWRRSSDVYFPCQLLDLTWLSFIS